MIRKTTKEILTDSFIELAQHKPVNKITVADVTSNCGMAAPTFYRHFKDKYDLIAWAHLREAQQIMGQIGVDGYQWRDTLLDAARYFARKQKFLVNALSHTSGRDAFENKMAELNTEMMVNEIRKKLMTERIPENYYNMVRLYCFGTVHFIYEWLEKDMPQSPEEVAELWEACLPEPLKPYLYP